MELTDYLILSLDLVGVFAFAVSGCLLAARKNFDITGGLILGLMVGLGGGMMRDVLLGEVPRSLQSPVYMVPVALASLLVYLLGHRAERARVLIIVFDAVGLSVFAVTGTWIAMTAGMPIASAVLLGVLTATGGGLLRDVVANENPALFNGSDLYLIPAASGALLTAIAIEVGLWGAPAAVVIAAFVFAFRILAWLLQWRVPQPMRGWSFRGIDAKVRRTLPAFGRLSRSEIEALRTGPIPIIAPTDAEAGSPSAEPSPDRRVGSDDAAEAGSPQRDDRADGGAGEAPRADG